MFTTKTLSFIGLALLALLAGCPTNTSGKGPDAAADGGDSLDANAPPGTGGASGSPLGAACSAAVDCASGFCTDGVCCDSACGQTCYACDQPMALGHCAALSSGEDPEASSTCTAPSACSLPASTTVPVCKFIDGTACQADSDCISRHCLTFYLDADGDGYGGADEGHFCEELNSPPPAGYAAYSGDCCDLDSGANPGFDSSQYLAMPNACGSFDWNCNGVVAQQKSCPTAIACGADCNISLGFFVYDAFTEACN